MGAAGANAHVSNIVGGFLFSMGAAGANAHVSNIVGVSFSLWGLLERMHMSPILLGHATLNCVVWHLFVDS